MIAKPAARLSAVAAAALLAGLAAGQAAAQDEPPPHLAPCVDSNPDLDPETSLGLCRAALAAAVHDEERGAIHIWLAIGLAAAGDQEAANAAADRAVQLFLAEETLQVQAEIRRRTGRYEDALRLAEEGLQQAPQSEYLERTRLLALVDLGRGAEALPGLERLHRKRRKDVDLILAFANALDAAGETEKRDRVLDRAIAENPEADGLRFARVLLRMPTRPAEATADLDVVIARAPGPDAYALRSFAHYASGDEEGARGDLSAVGEAEKLSLVPALYATFVAEGFGNLENALAFAERAVSVAPPSDLPSSLARRGEILMLQDRLDLAKADFERAALLDPEEAKAWEGLGHLSAENDSARAVIFFHRALSLNPKSHTADLGLTEALFWSGDYAAAETGYRRLLKVYPDDADMHAGLAVTLMRLERYEDARQPSERAVALAPDEAAYVLIRGELLFILGEAPAALTLMDQLTAMKGDTAYSHYLAAVIRRQQGNYEAALRDAEAGLALAPDDPELLQEKGGIYYMLDDPLSAQEWLEKALAIDPKYADALFLRGLVRAELGDAQGAAADRDAALALDPTLADEL